MSKQPKQQIGDWAETITDALLLAPPDDRAKILALATAKEAEQIKQRASGEHLRGVSLVDIEVRSMEGEYIIKSEVVLQFVRAITNNHSTQEADKILFKPHCPGGGLGSGALFDYISDLPTLQKKRGRRAA